MSGGLTLRVNARVGILSWGQQNGGRVETYRVFWIHDFKVSKRVTQLW